MFSRRRIPCPDIRAIAASILLFSPLFSSAEPLPDVQQVLSDARTAPRAVAEPSKVELERRIVMFADGISEDAMVQIASESGARVLRKLHLIHGLILLTPKAQADAVYQTLASRRGIVKIEKDPYLHWLTGVENGAAAGSPQPQTIPWGVYRVRAPKAWGATRGRGVKVCVIDTGIDYTHPDLKVAGGFNVLTNDSNFMDDYGHGTHVSGTIAALDNDVGVVGVAPEVSLYGVKALDSHGAGYVSDLITALQWAVDNRMDVVNMSLGEPQYYDLFGTAVQNALDAGVTIVTAAGNTGGPVDYPSAFPGVIPVSASDDRDRMAFFSSRGPEIAFIAPGVRIYSTLPGGTYGLMTGTSQACPHVAGLAALAIAAKGVHGASAVRSALQAAAYPLSSLAPNDQGAGMIDAGKLVGAVPSASTSGTRGRGPIHFDKDTYSCSDIARIQVFAPDWVTDPNAIDTIGSDPQNPLQIGTHAAQLRPYTLVETAPNSGVFDGSVRLLCGGQTASGRGPNDGILSAESEDGLTVSFVNNPGDVWTASARIAGADSGDAQVAFDRPSYALGATAVVTIQDPDAPTDPRSLGQIIFGAYSSSDQAGVYATAIETAPGSRVFKAALYLTNTNASSGNRLHAQLGDTVYASYLDATPDNPRGGRYVTATASISQ